MSVNQAAPKLLLGLIGSGIQQSLTPAMQEMEASHHGLRVHYQIIDLDLRKLGIEALPDEERDLYNTVAGLVMAVAGHLPRVAERVEVAGWVIEVVDLDGRRIDKLLVSPRA